MTEARYLSSLQKGLAKQELLPEDRITDDEMILGQSFNIPYGDKFIPRNKLHRVLAAHENLFRTIVLMADNPSFALNYINLAKEILNQQNQNLIRTVMDQVINTNFQGRKILIDEAQNNKTYPNFGIATLAYVEDNLVISQIIKVCKSKRGHPHEQIFDQLSEILLETNILNEKKFIILDIHSALGLCKPCFEQAEKLVKKFEEKGIELKINVSYVALYGYEIHQLADKIVQKQIELIFLEVFPPHGLLVSQLKSYLSNELEDRIDLDPQLIHEIVISDGRVHFESAIRKALTELMVQSDGGYVEKI